jgi:uncharacterized protein
MDDIDHDPQSLFEAGLALFNQADYFHAHEVWEDLWHAESGPDKLFAQALVQFAVILVHHQRGNARGVRAVSRTALAKLDGSQEGYRSLSRQAVRAELLRVITPTLALNDDAFNPGIKHSPGSLPLPPGPRATLAIIPTP